MGKYLSSFEKSIRLRRMFSTRSRQSFGLNYLQGSALYGEIGLIRSLAYLRVVGRSYDGEENFTGIERYCSREGGVGLGEIFAVRYDAFSRIMVRKFTIIKNLYSIPSNRGVNCHLELLDMIIVLFVRHYEKSVIASLVQRIELNDSAYHLNTGIVFNILFLDN